jgi:hypothetical protein
MVTRSKESLRRLEVYITSSPFLWLTTWKIEAGKPESCRAP